MAYRFLKKKEQKGKRNGGMHVKTCEENLWQSQLRKNTTTEASRPSVGFVYPYLSTVWIDLPNRAFEN